MKAGGVLPLLFRLRNQDSQECVGPASLSLGEEDSSKSNEL